MATNTSTTTTTTGGGGGVQVEGRALVHGAPWEEMVQAWDPESMLAVEASTPPLDACTGRTVTVAAFADALKRALEEEQGSSSSSSSRAEEAAVGAPSCGGGSTGAGWDGMSFDAAASSEFFAEYMEELSLSPSPFCGGNCSGSSSNHDNGSGRAGTATPDIFALSPRAATAAAASSEDESDLHSLAGGLPPTPPTLPGPSAIAPSTRVLVRFGGEDSSGSSGSSGETTIKSAKLYIGPLACDASVWAAWGLAPEAWAAFSQRVNADPSDLDGHVAALLQAARAAGLAMVEEGEGAAVVLTLPAGSRPAAALDVLIASASNTDPPASLLSLLTSNALPPHFWRTHFYLPHDDQAMEGRLAAGDANVVYTFLCAYLALGPSGGQHGKERHWEEAALTNGLKVLMHPIVITAAEQQEEEDSDSISNPAFPHLSLLGHAAEQEEEDSGSSNPPFPLSLLRGSSVSVPMDVPSLLQLGVDQEEDGGDLEAQLDMLLDAQDTAEQEEEEGAEAVVVKQGKGKGKGKDLGRLSSCLLVSQGQEGGGVRRRSGLRARRATVAYAEAEEESDAEEAEELLSSSSSASAAATTGSGYDYPGRPEPAGKRLPDRGRHKCRMPGCVEEYRWPDYFCKVHGGGRCQYLWWDESIPRCTKFHQSRNSNGELLCGEHSRATGARYGEQSRKTKAASTNGSGAAVKAKKAKRVVKRKKLW